MSNWISMADKTPPEDDRVIAVIRCKGCVIVDTLRGWMCGSGDFCVTHWMPLPEIPQDEEKEE